jgi:hypothetical protein
MLHCAMLLQEAAERELMGLAIALGHPCLSSDTKALCAAESTCMAWRAAVQQCSLDAACSLDIALTVDEPEPQKCLSSFACWLPKHAGLVRSITADVKDIAHVQGPCSARQYDLVYQRIEAAQQLLTNALQATAAQAAAVGEPATAAVPAQTAAASSSTAQGSAAAVHTTQQQQQQQQHINMKQFSSNCLVAPSLLAALPAHSLTRLGLNLKLPTAFTGRQLAGSSSISDAVPGSSEAVAAALAQLSSLQELHISGYTATSRVNLPGACIAGLAQLSMLTSLQITGDWDLDLGNHLAQLLQHPLPVRRLHIVTHSDIVGVFDLAQLTQLQELTTSMLFEPGSALPAQLQRLHLMQRLDGEEFLEVPWGSQSMDLVMQLQQLQFLHIELTHDVQDRMVRLARLPALQHVSLRLRTAEATAAAAAAPALGQLPQLRELRATIGQCSKQQAEAIAASLGAATGLTSLTLACWQSTSAENGAAGIAADAEDENEASCIAVGGKLALLTCLRELHLVSCSLVPADALALSVLTGLTELDLRCIGAGLTCDVAAALAGKLTELRRLELQAAVGLGSLDCLAALAQLTKLTRLDLHCDDAVSGDGLAVLRALPLQHLELRAGSGVYTMASVAGISQLTKLTRLLLDCRDGRGAMYRAELNLGLLSALPSMQRLDLHLQGE